MYLCCACKTCELNEGPCMHAYPYTELRACLYACMQVCIHVSMSLHPTSMHRILGDFLPSRQIEGSTTLRRYLAIRLMERD